MSLRLETPFNDKSSLSNAEGFKIHLFSFQSTLEQPRRTITSTYPPRELLDHLSLQANRASQDNPTASLHSLDTAIVDIASLLKRSDSDEAPVAHSQYTSATAIPPTTTVAPPALGGSSFATFTPATGTRSPRSSGAGGPGAGGSLGKSGSGSVNSVRPGSGGKRTMPPHTSESPAKKQSKWSPEEDALIIELRGSGMKWDDISKRLPGRSSISCRLHYQNYLERRSEWDEERKNKLARLYERFKPEMWAKVAEEMQVPWRAAEAMHWQLGEVDMARRAGVVPFALTTAALGDSSVMHHRMPTSRGHHGHSQSQGSLPRDIPTMSLPRYSRGPPGPFIPPPSSGGRPLAARRDSLPTRSSFAPPPPPHHHSDPSGYTLAPAIGLAPIHTSSYTHQSRGGMLPSVAELTTGVSPYSTPAYSMGGMTSMVSPTHSDTTSPGPTHPGYSAYPPLEPLGTVKRRASPEAGGIRETSRRRHHFQSRQEDGYSSLGPPPGMTSSRRGQRLE
ncbi:hypothetical protein B0T13DRAFT_403055 [Neurospora crassa]|nr:hypothetical protein B0T13DRAFT_403055 [Neurospora crassa]